MIEFKILEKTPDCAKDKTHYFCDYVELIALCSDEDGISNSDIYDRFLDDGKIKNIGSEDGSEANEQWVARIDNWFNELRSRAVAYGHDYPFEFKGNRLAKKINLDDRNHIYLGMLLCSLLKYIENSHVFSSAFEYASLCAMKEYLPKGAEVHTFGVSSRNQGKYVGSLEAKIRLLSADTNYPVSSRPNIFRNGDNGDGGLDVIAWLPFREDVNLDKKLLFIGQSAATMEWDKKQHSVERLLAYLDVDTKALNTLYVPFDMRDYERKINEWTLVTTDILFDRQRMVKLLKPEILFSSELGQEFKELILSAVEYEEYVV